MAWFNLDVSPIEARCKERGDIQHIRFRIRDFDPFDLRIKLPAAVQIVADQVAKGRKVYIHCTAGLILPTRPNSLQVTAQQVLPHKQASIMTVLA